MKNIQFALSLASPGFAEVIKDGEEYQGMIKYSKSRGLSCFPLPGGKSKYLITDGLHSFVFFGSEVFLSSTAYPRHNDKGRTKEKLSEVGISTPRGKLFKPYSYESVLSCYYKMGVGEVVLKPSNQNKGKGVFVGVATNRDLKDCYACIQQYPCLLEEFIPGDEHRFLVVGGRVVAVAKRTPANVVGNGRETIARLIEDKNSARKKVKAHRDNLIEVDDSLVSNIRSGGYVLSDILEEGKELRLRKVSNVSMGGDSIDVTEKVHADFIEVAERIWEVFPDRGVYAVDLIAVDITRSAKKQRYGVIEVNNRPMLAGLHGNPIYGDGRQVAKKIIDYVFG